MNWNSIQCRHLKAPEDQTQTLAELSSGAISMSNLKILILPNHLLGWMSTTFGTNSPPQSHARVYNRAHQSNKSTRVYDGAVPAGDNNGVIQRAIKGATCKKSRFLSLIPG